MEIKVIRFNNLAKEPKANKENDFCEDVYATSRTLLHKGINGEPDIYEYGIGLGFQINYPKEMLDEDGEKVAIQLRSRSSIWKTGLILSNGVGTLDYGYTGEVKAVFYHLVKSLKPYEVGERIGQIAIDFSFKTDYKFVESFEETDRNSNGYGSSGND